MKIIITFELPKAGKSYDVQIAGEQKIEDTLQVLAENIADFSFDNNSIEIREKYTGRKLSEKNTYQEEQIYSGTKIVIQEEIWKQKMEH